MSVRERFNVVLSAPMTQAQVDAMIKDAGFTLVGGHESTPEANYLALPDDATDTVRCYRPQVFRDPWAGEYVIQTESLNRGQVPASVMAFFEKAFEGCEFSWSRDYQDQPIAEGALGYTMIPESRF